MSSKCNGKPVSRQVRRRQLQRARTAVAIRANVHGIVQRFGIDRVGVMTLTFARHMDDARLAQTRLRSFRTGVLQRRYGGFLWVAERTRAGAVHFHVLVPTRDSIRPAGRRTRELRRRSEAAAIALRAEQQFLRTAAGRYGFGRIEFRPVRTNADALAHYFAKGFEDPDPARAPADHGVRMFAVSKSLSVANTRFSWLTQGGRQWRAKVAAHVAELVEQGVLPAGADLHSLTAVYGPAWALALRAEFINSADVSVPGHRPPACEECRPRCVDLPVHPIPGSPAAPQISVGSASHPTTSSPRIQLPSIRGEQFSPTRTVNRSDAMLYPLHPLCEAFPPIDPTAFDELVEDVAQNGLREPIVLFDGQVLDGRNRYLACLQAGVEARFREFGSDKGDGDDPVAFVLSKNLRRRHLTPSQQAAAVAKTQDWSQAHSRGGNGSNQHASKGAPVPICSTADRAAIAGVGVRTQKDADLVAREAPQLLEKVIAGEVSAKAAAAQVRAAKNTVGVEGAPTAEDFDSTPQSDVSAPEEKAAPVPASDKKDKPADPRDARIAELEEVVVELREVLELASEEIERLKAVGVDGEALKALEDRDARISVLKSQSNEWMMKCNELVKQVKGLRKVIRRMESNK